MLTEGVLIGRGELGWFRAERVTDRYGSVSIYRDGESRLHDDIEKVRPLEGKKGTLKALITEVRESSHMGDFCRDLYPSTPEVGDEVILGQGTLFFEPLEEDGKTLYSVGLRPDDERDSDWLNPKSLYRCHDQTVELFFVED